MPEVPTPTPEFEKRANALLNEWRKGTFSFVEAVDKFNTLKYEALQENSAANEALVERLQGVMRIARGHYDHAIRHFRTARDIHEQLGDFERLLMCDNNIGEVYRLKGELDRAHKTLQSTFEAAVRLGHPTIQAFAKSNHGRTLVNMERFDEAVKALKEALEIANSHEKRPELLGLISLMHSDLAMAYLGLDEHVSAFTAAQTALRLGDESREIRRLGQANRAMGTVLTVYVPETELSTDPDVYFETAIAHCRETRLDVDMALTYAAYGESLAMRGLQPAALEKLREALMTYERLGLQNEYDKVKLIIDKLAPQ